MLARFWFGNYNFRVWEVGWFGIQYYVETQTAIRTSVPLTRVIRYR